MDRTHKTVTDESNALLYILSEYLVIPSKVNQHPCFFSIARMYSNSVFTLFRSTVMYLTVNDVLCLTLLHLHIGYFDIFYNFPVYTYQLKYNEGA